MAGPHQIFAHTMGTGSGDHWWAWHQGRQGIPLDSEQSQMPRERGRRVHALLSALMPGQLRPTIRSLPITDRNHVEALYAWADETQPVIVEHEAPVRHEKYDVNGYIDYVRRCPGCAICGEYVSQQSLTEAEEDRYGVILGDLKLGRSIGGAHAHLQVGAGYRALWAVCRPEPVCGAELLGLLSEGFPQPYFVLPAAGTADQFDKAVAWFRELEATGHRVDALQYDRSVDEERVRKDEEVLRGEVEKALRDQLGEVSEATVLGAGREDLERVALALLRRTQR